MSWLFWYNLVGWIIAVGMAVVILRRRLPAATALGWLAVVFFLPLIGAALYLLIGTEVLGRKRRRLHREVISRLRPTLPGQSQSPHKAVAEDDPHRSIILQTERTFGMPPVEGNTFELLGGFEAYLEALERDIAAAREHVHMVFYIFEPDEFGRRVAQALANAAKQGVVCRLIADAAGSRSLFHRGGLGAWLREQGVDVRAAMPVSPLRRRFARIDLRNHRKLVVIDGCIAYTGSHNVINPEFVPGRRLECIDLSIRLTGPIVAQMQIVFVEDWNFETDEALGADHLFPEPSRSGAARMQTVPSGPDEESHTLQRVVIAAINLASRTLVMTTPYFIPDEPTLLSLILAANRGVDVHLVITRRSDYRIVTFAGRAFFDRLLENGVRISLYDDGMLHSKTMVIDDDFAMIGSANMDIRSFMLNFELTLLLYGREICSALSAKQEAYIARSTALNLENWRARPVTRQYLENACALLSPLL